MNKTNEKKTNNEFRQLRTKIFIKTAATLYVAVLISIGVIFGLYSFVLEGRFSNMVINFMNIFVGDYNAAYYFYEQIFRNNMGMIMLACIVGICLIVLWIYLKGFTKYFNEINRGIDALIEEDSADVILPAELGAVEKKINYIMKTLERRKTEAEIAEQRKNDLVVYLAHDLKTPLTSVIGYLTLLRDENQISEELRQKYLSISLEKAERLEELINEFFEITRFNFSNMILEYSDVNLTRMLEQLTYEFKPMFLDKNLKCELEIAPDTMLRCDVNKMQRVLDNLLRNAVNYSFDDSTIHIVATQNDKNINIRFVNRGNTIPEEKLQCIFEQFYRLDTVRSSKSGGAGLGLAIAKEIVELHGGSITAMSEDEIVEFELTIPLS